VVDYDEAVIRDALHRLERRGLARLASGAGSRATKYRHLLADALPMDGGEQAIVCVLLLRGPQTPGELKQRSDRMHAFADLEGVHATLDGLIGRRLAERLERRPGQKEERYRQRLGEPTEDASADADRDGAQRTAEGSQTAPGDLLERVARLEREVLELRAAMRDPVLGETP
jgi:uncharacterized protein